MNFLFIQGESIAKLNLLPLALIYSLYNCFYDHQQQQFTLSVSYNNV